MEIWKEIKNYEGLYEVSSYGNVRSLNYKRTYQAKILKTRINRHGYEVVDLSKDGVRKTCQVHRLVAETFLSNPEEFDTVDHIDSNKTNNHLNNLQWMSRGDNARKAWDDGLCFNVGENLKYCNKSTNRPTKKVINLTTKEIYDSITEAGKKNNINRRRISDCCRHKQKSAGGFQWCYLDDYNK